MDGDDKNHGLLNAATTAKKTIQGALDAIRALDLGGHVATVSVAAGGPYPAFRLAGPASGCAGPDQIVIAGPADPSPVTIQQGAAAPAVHAFEGARFTVANMTIGGANDGVLSQGSGSHIVAKNLVFGAIGGTALRATFSGQLDLQGPFAVGANCPILIGATYNGLIYANVGGAFAVGNNPTVTYTVLSDRGGKVWDLSLFAWSGTCVGMKWYVANHGQIISAPGGGPGLPGSVAGTTAAASFELIT